MPFFRNIEMVDLPRQWPESVEEQRALLQSIHVNDWDFAFLTEIYDEGPYVHIAFPTLDMPVGVRHYEIWQARGSLLILKAASFNTIAVFCNLQVGNQILRASYALANGRCFATMTPRQSRARAAGFGHRGISL